MSSARPDSIRTFSSSRSPDRTPPEGRGCLSAREVIPAERRPARPAGPRSDLCHGVVSKGPRGFSPRRCVQGIPGLHELEQPRIGPAGRHPPDGTVARRPGSDRSAAAVPLSAHWRSSRQTMIGAPRLSAQEGLDVLTAAIALFRSSRGHCHRIPLQDGVVPSNRASIRERAGRLCLQAQRPLPTLIDKRPAIWAISSSSRVLPIPASPSMTSTVPTPDSSLSRCSPMVTSTASLPR